MSGVKTFSSRDSLVTRLRDDLNNKQLVLLYAYNRTGKTRLSMDFKDKCKSKNNNKSNVLYFNAFTEDLFTWENDLDLDVERKLKINHASSFFDGFQDLGLEPIINDYLGRYTDFEFDFEYGDVQQAGESFTKPLFVKFRKGEDEHIKISRGEECIFIWCVFMAICELVLDAHESYNWVEYIYIDDPISSLDDNNAIAVTCDLAKLIRKVTNRKKADGSDDPLKVVVSSHHSLFFNVMCNEIGRAKQDEPTVKHKRYFLHRPNNDGVYTLQSTEDTPFFHHVASLAELKKAADPETGTLYTFHFNSLRSIMEKTSAFFGHKDITFCLKALNNEEDRAKFNRALNLLSHGGYSLFEPTPMGDDNQDLFRDIFASFITRFQFDLPDIFGDEA